MSSTEQFDAPQLTAARAKAWHQDGERLLTLEAARSWIEARGLVLFAPRPQQLPAPAPSLVEATLGTANAGPTLADTESARSFVARLAAEGVAVPLNLLGVPGDAPDFVVSAQVFSFIFTLRGDKAWKQPPATSGAVKVSPLGLRVYEVLGSHGSLTASELASELGREVTEAAILRALTELWSQLRVLPLADQGEGATRWELTTKRFTKTLKAGANAGLPTALSALISLYLAQAVAATEDEIAAFLSPLTARSRVKEVLHALLGARQLDTIVVEGKTLVHIPGTLPAGEVAEGESAEAAATTPFVKPKKIGTGRPKPAAESGEGRISSFKSERKTAGEFRGKPAGGKPARTFGALPGTRPSTARPSTRPGTTRPAGKFAARPAGKFTARPDRERRPFKRDDAGTKPAFDKPWSEDRKPRAEKSAAPDAFTKYRKPEGEERKPLGRREQAGLPDDKRTPSARSYRPRDTGEASFPAKRPYKPREGGGDFAKRPYKPREAGAGSGFAAKRPYKPRDAEGGSSFAKRPYTPRTTGGGEGFAAKRPYKPREAGAAGGLAAKRPYKPRDAGAPGAFPKRPYTPREGASAGGSIAARRPYTPHVGGDDAPRRTYTPREGGDSAPKRPYKPREGAGAYDRSAPRKTFGAKPAFGSKPAFGAKPGFKKAGFSKSGPGRFGGSKRASGGFDPRGTDVNAPSGWVKPARRRDKPGTEE